MSVAEFADLTGVAEAPVWDPDPALSEVMTAKLVAWRDRERAHARYRWNRITGEQDVEADGPGGDDMLMDRITDIEALITQLTAQQSRDMQALRTRRRREQAGLPASVAPWTTDKQAWTASEIGAPLGLTQPHVNNRMAMADRMDHHPEAAALLTEGALPAWTAHKLLDHLETLRLLLPTQEMNKLETATVQWLRERPRTVAALDSRMNRLIIKAKADAEQGKDDGDGDGDEGPASRAHAARRVEINSLGDGTAELWALIPEADALAVLAVLKAARDPTIKTPDEHRTRTQRQADILIGSVTGSPAAYGRPEDLPGHNPHHAPVAVRFDVTVPVRTTTGQSNSPGEVPGYGPIPALTVRDLLSQPGPGFRALLYDPATGTLLGLTDPTGNLNSTIWADHLPPGNGYAHPPRTDLILEHRDRTCRASGCNRIARRCDKDHIIRWPKGPTTTANSCCLCRYHHRLKTHAPGWKLQGNGNNQLTWTTPTNRKITTRPHDYRQPEDNNDTPS